MLTPETIQGGQDAVPGYGCKTPPPRLVLPPWFPYWPLTNRASWYEASRFAGYELAGHAWSEQTGTALDRTQNIGRHPSQLGQTLPPGSIIVAAVALQKASRTRQPARHWASDGISRPQQIDPPSTASRHPKGKPLHPQPGGRLPMVAETFSLDKQIPIRARG